MVAILFAKVVFLVSVVAALRTFSIDYENNQFLKDGKPFRYISGEVQYYRVPRELWRDRLTKMRLAGVNAVQTYIEWSTHEPEPGHFKQLDDITNFIKIAQDVGLLVILRPGPFINSERDFGGFPYWLTRDDPSMVIRSSDASYLRLVNRYLATVLPLVRPLLYHNGGPVIMVQVENEYGTHGNDTIYTTWLRDAMKAYLVDDVVLFTTDTILDAKKGKIDGAYGTVDFGADASDVEFFFSLRSEPRGPFVNSEYYVGWIDRWSQPHETRSTELAVNTLKNMLDLGASVNIFLFHGGTNFGFKSGANGLDNPVVPTSYDWDAPLSEAGDPTGKYFALRGLIGQYLPLPRGSLPTTAAKFELDSVHMYPSYSLADIIKAQSSEFTSQFPMTFEQLGVDGGYVIYRTTVNFQASDPSLLSIAGLRDRAHVILDGQLVGILSRYGEVSSMPLRARKGSDLFILVENQGRFCYGQQVVTDHTKGILGNVTLGSVVLTKWTHHYHLKLDGPVDHLRVRSEPFLSVPAVYGGAFMVPEGSNGLDTFLRLDGWGKGVAFVNGVNIGRYWPDEGPQVTLYLPHVWLRPNHVNYIYIFETDRSPCMLKSACVVSLTGTHVLNGTTPVNLL